MSAHIQEEMYTHEHLWRSSTVLYEAALNRPDDSYHLLLPTLLTAYLAYEAFVNFVGYVLLPEIWEDERNNFKGKGLEGKLERILSEMPEFEWRKGARPYQTIRRLEAFRNLVSHGKVQASEYLAPNRNDGLHFRFRHVWDEFMTRNAVERARFDIKEFCQCVVEDCRKHCEHPHLNHDAFEGSLASGSSSFVG